MSTKLEKLMFRIALIDRASGPIGKIDSQVRQLKATATKGGVMLGGAAAGGWALQRSLSGLLDPAIEINRALGEVKSLDVHGKALDKLQRSALTTSIQYGTSAADFIRASYDIQSAISGLKGDELARFTKASAVLAMGTKSDVGTITDYMGTMYGIFQKDAEKLGNAKWVEIVAGQTATAVQMFKTTGAEMAAAYSTLGAEGQSHGIQMAEQMAIMGQLQSTMSGSESGTKYKAFLQGIGKAQSELGLQFTDSHGRMLPILDILGKLEGRLAGLGSVEQGQLLMKAFGRKEAVSLIQQLMLDTKGLANNIQALGNVKGMEKARRMATEISDPFDRWRESSKAVRAVIGNALLPVITPLIDKLTAANATMVDWSYKFPHLTKAIGITVLVIAGLISVVLLFAAVGGVVQLTMAGLIGLQTLWTGVTAVGAGALGLLTKGLKAARIATLLFSLALYANPLVWVAAAVIGLVAGLALLVIHWDTVKAAALGFIGGFIERWSAIREAINSNPIARILAAPFLTAINLIGILFDLIKKIPALFTRLKNWLGELGVFDALGNAADWVIEKLNLIPGINIEATVEKERSSIPKASTPQYQLSAVPAGGISQHIQNNQKGGTHIEKVEVFNPASGYGFVDEMEMAAG
ncbi:phage tail tape measure protein [Microbulbifer sp. OS29]|uniref:Phage tail tape measure protein n=1 Tax=Microbulbifer okhotskensis TaxID=2926617 RepID=A0A9X2EQ26_9GAMM|nr:phage tail tape measure protein [Microbulbifer okhotskensis]MCO1336322.1 phage tail tape measure protein [Microbulbifer okhotskensis]